MSRLSSSSSALAAAWPSASWFEDALGFKEDKSYKTTQATLLEMQTASSEPATMLRLLQKQPNNNDDDVTQQVRCGRFWCPNVRELRAKCDTLLKELADKNTQLAPGKTRWSNLSASVLDLTLDAANSDATFQAASQFNCLEFASPSGTPEKGITQYHWDHTQGPACAMACAAGTAYRNYLVPIQKTPQQQQIGQTAALQINNLDGVLEKLQLDDIQVVNGYADGPEQSLYDAARQLESNPNDWIDLIKVGVQQDTEVTYPKPTGRTVTQVYCSAVPINYSRARPEAWQGLAEIVLAGVYEATLLVAIYNTANALLDGDIDKAARCQRVFLTFIGGGVFGNRIDWIQRAMQRAHVRVAVFDIHLAIAIVHYGSFDADDVKFVMDLN